jgi:hypothetical protein
VTKIQIPLASATTALHNLLGSQTSHRPIPNFFDPTSLSQVEDNSELLNPEPLFGYPNSQLFVSSNMASKLLPGVLSMTLIAHEQPIFQPYKLAIAAKFDPASTSILDRIGSQYMWYPISSCAKLYRRFMIKRSFLPHTHPEYLGQHAFCMRVAEDSQRTKKPSPWFSTDPISFPDTIPNRKKASDIIFTAESEELRAVRSAILQKTQYIDLELRRIRRLKEYKGLVIRHNILEQISAQAYP